MSKKIEIIGNALVITDTLTGVIELDKPSKDVYFNNEDLNRGYIMITQKDGSRNIERSIGNHILLSNSVDSSDTIFTKSTFRTFARNNLVFSSALGSSRAIAQTILLTPATTTISAVDTEQDVNLTGNTQELKYFTFNGINTFTYTGVNGVRLLFLGNASEEVITSIVGGSLVEITMVLRKNGVIAVETPVTYDKELNIKDFSANRTFLNVQNGDTFKLQIKSDTLVDVSIKDLYIQIVDF